LSPQIARSLLAAAAGLGLLACKTPYQKEGATPEDFERDKYACFAEARSGTWGYGGPRDELLFAKCMELRGWIRTAKESATEGDEPHEKEPPTGAQSQ
jgi:hypothetical protein